MSSTVQPQTSRQQHVTAPPHTAGISGQSSDQTSTQPSPALCPPGHHRGMASSGGPPGDGERVETEGAQRARSCGGGQGEVASSSRHLKAGSRPPHPLPVGLQPRLQQCLT
mmetsp:Transcript_26567/g.76200  ORF Transcript_26567/g.76200 Transcript_26567/m.76200 type:complete len:111 (+) Transcript_26567:132-464(+)